MTCRKYKELKKEADEEEEEKLKVKDQEKENIKIENYLNDNLGTTDEGVVIH